MESIFSEASKDCGPCSPPPWTLSGQVSLPRHPPGPSNRALTVYLLTQLMSEGKIKDVILLMGNNQQLLESIKAKNISKEISRLLSKNPSIIKSTKTPISWVSYRFNTGRNVPAHGQLPEHHPRKVIRRSPVSARPICTFSVQRQEEILRVRDKSHTLIEGRWS